MPIPGWAPPGGSWTTHLPGWRTPPPPPPREIRPIVLKMGDFHAATDSRLGTPGSVVLRRVSGVWDGAPDTTATSQHPSGDGVIRFRERTGPRRIEASGLIEGDLAANGTGPLMTKIEQVKAATRSGVLLIEEHDRSMFREVGVRRVDFTADPITNAVATFSIMFEAEDPVLYGRGVSTLPRNVATPVTNSGDVTRCYPILEWTGAASNPGVDFGNLSWRLGENTTSGDQIVVDCREGAVFKNGSRIFPDWTGFWPYVSGTFRFTAIGTSMTMRRRSGWS